MYKLLSKDEIETGKDKINGLFRQYVERVNCNDWLFYPMIMAQNFHLILMDDKYFGVFEIVNNKETVTCNIWQIYAPNKGEEMLKAIEVEAKNIGATSIGFYSIDPDLFRIVANKIGYKEKISYFVKEGI
jgi:hypothetical protein